jgi:hypothetical protein
MSTIDPTPENEQTPKSELISLSFERRQLGEFITNLLGQRRRLSRSFDVLFTLTWTWLYNLDELIVQRVENQNEGSLVDFSFKVFLASGRTTHLTTRADFKSFRDISAFETVGIELVWTFLVKFPSPDVPEKQEIRFSAKTTNLDRGMARRKLLSYFDNLTFESEELLLEVYYSNITWGEDIMMTVSNHVFAAFKQRNRFLPKLASLFNKLSSPIFLSLFFLSMMYNSFSTSSKGVSGIAEAVKSIPKDDSSLEAINLKLNALIDDRLHTALGANVFFPVIISGAGVLVIMVCVLLLEYFVSRSFILLNDFSEKRREAYLARRHVLFFVITLAFIVGTASSLFASRIVSYFTG